MAGTTLEINGHEVWVDIEVTNYSPFRAGKVGHPDNWMPDEDEEIEVSVKLNAIDITNDLTDAQYDQCCDAALEHIRSLANEYDE